MGIRYTTDQLADIEACRALVLDFAAAVDLRTPERMRELFTPDATFARPIAPDTIISGIDAIVGSFTSRPAHIVTQHLNTNVRVWLTGPDTAEGDSVVLLFLANAGDAFVPGKGRPSSPPLVGYWKDRFVRTADGWRFAERRGTVTMYVPG